MSAVTPPAWATSAQTDSSDTTPLQLAELGEHVTHCAPRGGRWSLLLCAADRVHGFMLGHRMTTLAVLACGMLATWLIAS